MDWEVVKRRWAAAVVAVAAAMVVRLVFFDFLGSDFSFRFSECC